MDKSILYTLNLDEARVLTHGTIEERGHTEARETERQKNAAV